MHPRPPVARSGSRLRDPLLRVAVAVAACLLAQAVVAKEVLGVTLDPGSQFAALWVFLASTWTGDRGRRAEVLAIAAAVAVTVSVLVLYAVW